MLRLLHSEEISPASIILAGYLFVLLVHVRLGDYWDGCLGFTEILLNGFVRIKIKLGQIQKLSTVIKTLNKDIFYVGMNSKYFGFLNFFNFSMFLLIDNC